MSTSTRRKPSVTVHWKTAQPRPRRAVLALGYAGWDAGQLEDGIQRNGWLHCPADPALLFDRDLSSKYTRALRSMGVELERLSSSAGHA